ncbi:hypothetical protein GYH30_009733 [Glycine max]|nr:hypothetical protein GYH30_009733 [Glycine max]
MCTRNYDNEAETSLWTNDASSKQHCFQVPLPTGTVAVEKDEEVVRDTSPTATLNDVVAAIKHLAQQMENIENQNKKRLDAIDKTNTSMLKAIYTLAKQDYKDSTKDGDKDVAMSETHENTYVYRQPLHFQNVNKRVSNPTVKCTTNQAYGKSDATLNNIETIFILGDDDDDDDEFLRPLDKGMKGKFAEIVKDSSIPPRTLSFPNDKSISGSSKKQKIDNHVQPTWNASGYQYSKGSSLGSINNNKPTWMFHRPQPNSSRGYTHTIPKDMPCTFKPTVDMNLNFEETQVCAYVFNPKVDPRYVRSSVTHKNYITYD